MKAASASRRSFLQLTSAVSAAAAFHIVTEPMLAYATVKTHYSPGMVRIDSNENPLGPCAAAREAATAMIPQGGRYNFEMSEELEKQFALTEGLKPEYVRVYPGSSSPLYFGVRAHTSPTKNYVTADPGYEAGMFAAEHGGARVVKVPLSKNHSHDVKAMLAAGQDAGLFYVCTPNNPTGTLTSHQDIEYLVENKPAGSVVMVDEAYIHFSDATTAMDLVKANKDVILLRTFSKIYGMAGMRCGFAIARPDLIEKLDSYGGSTYMPVTAVVAAKASLNDAQLVPERKRINATVRGQTFQWLDKNGYSYIPSESNCFMLDTRRPGKEVIAAMAKQGVMVGRIWPVMPSCVRITVGTQPEMEQFQAAFRKVMAGAVTASVTPNKRSNRFMIPS